MTALPFPKHHTSPTNTNLQAKKKDIAALLSNHIQPNPTTSLTLTDPSGKTIAFNCNTGDPVELLGLAMGFLSH